MMEATKRSQIAWTASTIVGALVWALAPLLTEKQEAWDAGYYFVTAVIASFIIALATYRWYEVACGWALGQVLYLATFKSNMNLAMVAIALLFGALLPLAASLTGCAIRWLAARALQLRA